MKNIFIIAILMAIFIFTAGYFFRETEEQKIPEQEINSIVSLSPSITREIIDLDSENLLAGVTSYHPPLKKKVEIVGNLLRPNVEKISLLKPDIILFSKEDNTTQNTDSLRRMNLSYFVFDINNDFEAICRNYLTLGKILKKEKLAETKLTAYRSKLQKAEGKSSGKKIVFLVSLNPLIAASGNSFIGSIIKYSGGENIYADLKKEYPIISIESLISLRPDIIISMTEGAEDYFIKRLKSFTDIPFMKNKKIFSIKPDRVAYYTPADFIAAVKIISEIIQKN